MKAVMLAGHPRPGRREILRIALIGHGKMGAALLARWRRVPGHSFFVIDPACTPVAAGGDGGSPVQFLDAAPAPGECRFDLVIVAVKPQLVDAVLPDYAARLAPGGFVASIAAGCSIARLQALMGGAPVIRIMPNLPAAIGAGVSGLCAGPGIGQPQRDALAALMAAAGSVIWVADEDRLDRFTAVAGSGPGYVFEIARTWADAAQALGFSAAEARTLVLETIVGAATMAVRSHEPLADLRDDVTSRGGTTAAGLAALNGDGGLSARLQATLDAAYARAVELR
jgi:pyrroline-5-carboxylate reductase